MSQPPGPCSATVPAPAQQLELGFAVSYEVTPIHGYTDRFTVRTHTVALGANDRLTTEQAARELGVSQSTVQRLCKAGALRAHTPGLRDLRIFRADLERYKKERGIRNN